MNKNAIRYLLWLVVLPILSLFISYACLRVTDAQVSRDTVYTLAIVAIILPIFTLGLGILKAFRLQNARGIVIASLASSLFWVILAALMNYFLIRDNSIDVSFSQYLTSVVVFTITSMLLLLLVQVFDRRTIKPIPVVQDTPKQKKKKK